MALKQAKTDMKRCPVCGRRTYDTEKGCTDKHCPCFNMTWEDYLDSRFNNEYFKALRLTHWNSFYEQNLRRFLPVFHKDRKFIHICFCGVKTRIRFNK